MTLLSRKGFFFIEGSTVLVGIWVSGILAAAMFPSMTAYLQRSRDVARTAGIKDIATTLGAYYADREEFPESEGGCIPAQALTTYFYGENGIPKDPTPGRLSGNCDGKNGTTYGYGKYKNTAGYEGFYLIAEMERPTSGNSPFFPENIIDESSFPELQKGTGKYYIFYK